MSFPQSFICFLQQLLWDHFFQPSSCVSSPEECTDRGLESQQHLCALLSLEWRARKGAAGSERPSGGWRPQGTTSHARKTLLCTGYLQHLNSFLGCTSNSEGLRQRAVLLTFWGAMRSLCAASRRKPSMTCLRSWSLQALSLWRLCWSWLTAWKWRGRLKEQQTNPLRGGF